MAEVERTATRDVIVIGASAGGVEALPRLIGQLAVDLPAAVFVCQHLRPAPDGFLVHILRRTSPMPVDWAIDGEPIARSRVRVAPPDVHLLVGDEGTSLVEGPRENHSRPSINRLFRSAAASHGARTIGVLLTGMLDDGVAGLAAIRECGGIAIVQDPADAAFPDLPRNAAAIGPDHVRALDDIAPLLAELVLERAAPAPVEPRVAREAELDATHGLDPGAVAGLGEQSVVSCGECGGPLWRIEHGAAVTYRCYLGHAASAQELLEQKGRDTERSLWEAVRSLQERATLFGNLAADARRGGRPLSATDFEARSVSARGHAERARDFLLELQRIGYERRS